MNVPHVIYKVCCDHWLHPTSYRLIVSYECTTCDIYKGCCDHWLHPTSYRLIVSYECTTCDIFKGCCDHWLHPTSYRLIVSYECTTCDIYKGCCDNWLHPMSYILVWMHHMWLQHFLTHVSGRPGNNPPEIPLSGCERNIPNNPPPIPYHPSLTSSSVHHSSHQRTVLFLTYYNVIKITIIGRKGT